MFKRYLKIFIDVFDLKVLIVFNVVYILGGRKLEKWIRLWCLDIMLFVLFVVVNRFLMIIKLDESDYLLGLIDEKVN